jgi:gamma-glutamylcyclotransferase (GGCT)/AIG2-like uncharacterized protein YtfP
MKIINTFVPRLTAFKFHSKDELERNLDLWTDEKYLFTFFEKNEEYLAFFKVYTIKEAVLKTIKQARLIQEKLYEYVQDGTKNLDELFQNLDDNEYHERILSKQKSKQFWLRLYAIKIETNHYVITGGAIKLVHKMRQSELTIEEKQTIEKCRNYLLDNEVYDADFFYEFIL